MINRLSAKVIARVIAVFVVGVLLVPTVTFAQWREPTGLPPQDNVPRPLNQGTQFIGEASSTSFVTGTYANQGTNGSIVLKVEPCPNGQTYVVTGGKWACGTAGGGNQNLLQVLTNGSNASAFTSPTYIGGPLLLNIASPATVVSKLQVQGDAGSWAGVMAVNQTGSGALLGANLPQSGLPNLRAGIFSSAVAGEWAGYFFGGQGVYIDQKLGIGTTAPTAQLDVRAAAGNRAAYLEGDVFINSKVQFPSKVTSPNDGGNYILTTNQNADLMVMAQNNLYLIIDEQPAITGGDLVVAKDDSTTPALFTVKNNGNVGIGTAAPGTKLEVAGQVKITGGAPGVGKVLTSDAAGLATWQNPAGGGTLPTGTNDQTLRNNNGTWVATSGLTVGSTGIVTTADNLNVGTVGTNPKPIVVSGNGAVIGSLAVGTLTASIGATLDVNGQIRIRGGVPAAGKVLTSDANGLATWATPASAGPWTKTGTNIYPTTLTDSVGIGTATPNRRLDITAVGTAQISLNSTPAAGTGSWDGMVFRQNNTEKWYTGIKGDNANADYVIRRNAASNDILIQNSTGNVGIGTVTPGAKLEVGGQIKITGGTPGVGKVLTSDATGLATWATPASAGPWTETAPNVYPTTLTNKVGVGTNAPVSPLHVYSATANANVLTITAPSNANSLAFRLTTEPTVNKWIEYLSGNDLRFWDTADRLTLQAGGNVGIGTATPAKKLTVAGTTNGGALIGIDNTQTASYDGVVISRSGVEKWFTGTNGANSNADFVIRRNGATNDVTVQNSTGNVGIGTGTASPESLLSVGKSAPGTRGGEISIANTASPSVGNEAALNFSVGNTVSNNNYGGDAGDAQIKARSMASNNATDLVFSTYNGTSFGERMRIQSGGNVGIGTATPDSVFGLTIQGGAAGVGNGIIIKNASSIGVRVSLTPPGVLTSVSSELGYYDQQNMYAVRGITSINGKSVYGNLGYYDQTANRSYGVYGRVGTDNPASFNYGGYFEGQIGVEILSTDFYALHAKNSKYSTVEAYLAKDLAVGSAGVIGNAVGSANSVGVAGNTDLGRGVYGIATGAGGRAVEGNAANSTGLAGYFHGGSGVRIGDTNDGVRDYIQLDAASSAPPATDCDSDTERGRMIVDSSSNNRLYICNGAARGWDYVALTN